MLSPPCRMCAEWHHVCRLFLSVAGGNQNKYTNEMQATSSQQSKEGWCFFYFSHKLAIRPHFLWSIPASCKHITSSQILFHLKLLDSNRTKLGFCGDYFQLCKYSVHLYCTVMWRYQLFGEQMCSLSLEVSFKHGTVTAAVGEAEQVHQLRFTVRPI